MKPIHQRTVLWLEQLEDRTLLSAAGVFPLGVGAAPSSPLPLTAAPATTLPTLANGSFLTNQSQLQITGTTQKGDTVRLETGSDNNFDEGSTVADLQGHFILTVPLTEGLNTLRLRVTDGLGNQGNAHLRVTLDDQAPTVVVSKPAPGLVTNHDPTLTGKVSDPGDPVALLQAAVDGGPYSTIAFTATGQFSFKPTLATNGSADGPHVIHIRATDKAGNQSVPTNFSFVLDATPPALVHADLDQINGKIVEGQGGSASFVFSQPLNPTTVTAKNFQLTGPSGSVPLTIQLLQNNTVVQVTVPTLPPGSYQFTLNAPAVKDLAGTALGATIRTWHWQVSHTFTWINPAGGDWSNPANWNRGTVPGPGDDVVIDVPGNVVITHSQGNDSIHSLVSADPIQLTGGVLAVSGTVQVNNTFTLAGGTLRGAQLLAGSGGQGLTLTGAGGTLDGVTTAANLDASQTNGASATIVNGLTLNHATLFLGNTANLPTSGTLTFTGIQTLGGVGTVVFGSSAANKMLGTNGLTLGAGILVKGGSGTLAGTMVNKGTITSNTTGGAIAIDASNGTFTNQGSMASENGILVFTAAQGSSIVNDGILTKGEGTTQGGGDVAINGDFTQGSTGQLTLVFAGSHSQTGGMFQVTGNATLAGTLDLINTGPPLGKGDGGKAMKYGSVTGKFTTIEGSPPLAAGLSLKATYTSDGLVLLVT